MIVETKDFLGYKSEVVIIMTSEELRKIMKIIEDLYYLGRNYHDIIGNVTIKIITDKEDKKSKVKLIVDFKTLELDKRDCSELKYMLEEIYKIDNISCKERGNKVIFEGEHIREVILKDDK